MVCQANDFVNDGQVVSQNDAYKSNYRAAPIKMHSVSEFIAQIYRGLYLVIGHWATGGVSRGTV